VARLGGDEFAVLCAGLDPAGQQRLTDRLAAVIAEPLEVDGGHRVTVDASIGVASTRDGAESQTLMTTADQAMFDAKHAGRGRVVAPV
jgi:diguanylate cyclase (GGDEF)-like protein